MDVIGFVHISQRPIEEQATLCVGVNMQCVCFWSFLVHEVIIHLQYPLESAIWFAAVLQWKLQYYVLYKMGITLGLSHGASYGNTACTKNQVSQCQMFPIG